MKKFFFLSFLIYFCLLSVQANNKPIWKPLFGKNLTEAEYNPEAWTETGGVLTADMDECIWTIEEFENFELDLNFRNESGTNSGVIIYCTNIDEWIPNSVEVQIADDHFEEWSAAKSYERCGAIYGHLGPLQANIVKQPGEWNHLRIRCNGKRITVILNGKKITDMDMNLWTSGTINPDGSEIPSWLPKPFASLPTKGFIGLQGKHGEASISFRNIRIRDLKDSETRNSTKREREPRQFPEY